MFKGTIKAGDLLIKVSGVEAIDKGVDTYFTGTAEAEVPEVKAATLNLTNSENAALIIKNCVITKGGKKFEGYGQE